ncbi:MAG: hypothetical protein JSS60_04835 [Verrucomicrobia bacterium]|nr:hypothetical protein [Verrucomicrobiota bacterium]
MKHSLIATVLTMLFSTGFCATMEEQNPNPKGIQVVPVDPTPDPDHVETKIWYPKQNEMKMSSPVKGQIRLEGIALGVDTEQPRKKEIWNDTEGQSLHIFIDNQPYFAINEALIDALDDVQDYFDQTADFEIPFKLQPGMHVIRTFPVRSYNESIKSDKAFAASVFYYQEKKDNPQVDLTKPYITYNEPQGEYDYDRKNLQPILLDFYITNCELSKDGYKVRLTIDNENLRTLTSWQPYYIYGLKKGMHRIRLELLDPQNNPVPGLFNDVTRTIVIK